MSHTNFSSLKSRHYSCGTVYVVLEIFQNYEWVILSRVLSYISAGPIMVAGCPFDWCSEIPKIHVEQFMVGYVFALLGYPFCVALCGALFSKSLGPIPQVSKSAAAFLVIFFLWWWSLGPLPSSYHLWFMAEWIWGQPLMKNSWSMGLRKFILSTKKVQTIREITFHTKKICKKSSICRDNKGLNGQRPK